MAATSELHITADASQAISEIRSLRAEVEALRAELDRARSPRLQIMREPLTYQARLTRAREEETGFRAISPHGNRSYIRDFVLAEVRGDADARERLDRHRREMKVLGEERGRVFYPGVDYEFEQRAVSWTSGLGGYFAPPLWIVEQYAVQPTPERVLASMAPQFELPDGAQSVNIPAFTTGPEADLAPLGSSVGSPATVDTAISSAVATIAGNWDVPMQMLEQSPQGAHLDWVAFSSMEARYGYRLEQQMINGNGASVPQGSGNNQLVGLLNNSAVPTSNVLTYDDATPTTAEMITTGTGGTLAKVVAAIGNNRKIKPECWLMTTSRASWLISQVVDFPLTLSNQTGPGEYDVLAYPVKQDEAIPTNLGGGTEDRIIACRPSDWLILESERRTSVFSEVLSGSLMARLQMRRYVAALLRYPTSVAWLQGTGLAVQSGF